MRYRKYIGSLPQRLGYLPVSFNLDGDESIWIHAVSVGEVLTARALLPELRERYPRLRLFLSTTTLAGQQMAREQPASTSTRSSTFPSTRLHRQPHAAAGAAAAVHHDGDRDLAEPAARLPARRRQDDARQRPHLVALVSALPARAALLPPRARPRRSLLHAERRVGAAHHRHRRRARARHRHRLPEVRLARASRRRRRASASFAAPTCTTCTSAARPRAALLPRRRRRARSSSPPARSRAKRSPCSRPSSGSARR